MKKVYGYSRVSSTKQGEGVSLQEQKSAIQAFAKREGLVVCEWFEEKVTAAKRGRPLFSEMLQNLRAGHADGVIIHKIDRSARNLKDWAEIGSLIDEGIEVHFANEAMDLTTRGGRLSANVQAVVAEDFIRNLKEESRKGMVGRLKQGLCPWGAPIGYLNMGKGKPKKIDPKWGSIIRLLFELYATGNYTLDQLRIFMVTKGLVMPNGDPFRINRISAILNNPFYYGVIRLRSTGELFQGIHEPLIPFQLFNRCQDILHGRTVARPQTHDFIFRRSLRCKHCNYSLIGERQKGHIYYRCQTKGCPTKTIREEVVSEVVEKFVSSVNIDEKFRDRLLDFAKADYDVDKKDIQLKVANLKNKLQINEGRLSRLTDTYVDGNLDLEIYLSKQAEYMADISKLKDEIASYSEENEDSFEKMKKFLELHSGLYPQYISGDPYQKREVLNMTTSNRIVDGKYVAIEPKEPFAGVAESMSLYTSAPSRGLPRTFEERVREFYRRIKQQL